MSACRSRFGVAACRAGIRCPARSNPSLYVPRDSELAEYYEATDVKHFSGGADVPGSKFTGKGIDSLEDVVQVALDEGKDLFFSDDRNVFFSEDGVSLEAFSDGYRYLKVGTGGTVGAVRLSSLDEGTEISVVRTKPGSPCSLVAVVTMQPVSDSSVLIVADHNETGLPFVVTAFPGVPTKPVADSRIDELEGTSLSVTDVHNMLGYDAWVNTRLKGKVE